MMDLVREHSEKVELSGATEDWDSAYMWLRSIQGNAKECADALEAYVAKDTIKACELYLIQSGRVA
jgi:hypothetical protein